MIDRRPWTPPSGRLTLVLATLLLLPGCGRSGSPTTNASDAKATAPAPSAPAPIELLAGMRIVDLSHDFSSDTIYWPTEEPFELEGVEAGVTPGGWFYAANRIHAAEHGGTHLDAPLHFAAQGLSADEIPVERFIGPGVVVDVASARSDADALAGVADLEAWEAAHGRIPDGALVLFRTGWSERWPDRLRYLGTTRTGPEAVAELHFPGIDPEAARWLLESRRVAAIGIDTASIDRGTSQTFDTHRVVLGANVPAFENLDRLEELPASGSVIIALPMKIRRGSGSPARIVGLVPYR